ncbi:MAG: hypothetical protein KBA71_06325 [Opitutaceae bacterium]|nr:hypothetical protein [Opitutaceae bacterium]
MKRVLIVSPRWVPFGSPDLQRVRMSLTFYRANGWEPVILCVDPRRVPGIAEPELAETIPGDVRTYHCAAIPSGLSRLAGIGSLGIRSLRHLWRSGAAILQREQIDLVFVSTTEFLACLAARLWNRGSGVPYIIDLQDPWRNTHYEDTGAAPPGGWKYPFARLVARLFEERAFSGAGGFISVSPRYLEDLHRRYPWMRSRLAETIEFGGSAMDLAVADRLAAASAPPFTRAPGEVHLVCTGAAGPIGEAALDSLFRTVRALARTQPEQARRLQLHFVGTSYDGGTATPSILPVAARWEVESQVHEVPARIGYLQSLRWQSEADALLLPASADSSYSPSKLYPYFLSGKPILAIVRKDSRLRSLLEPLGGSVTAITGGSPDAASPDPVILSFLHAALNAFPPGSIPARQTAYFHDHYSAQTLTRRQCAMFDQVARGPNSQAPTSTHAPR